MDLASLCLNASYVYLELRNTRSENTVNLIGSVSISIMWLKLFYWMRIFKSYAAFIRMVEEIILSIKVFVVMMLMILFAFASVIIVL